MFKNILWLYLWQFICFSSFYPHVDGLICYVCKPFLGSGGTTSNDLGLKMIANISRTYANKIESDFGDCTEMSLDPKFQILCPFSGPNVVCLEIRNDFWYARTCGFKPEVNTTENGLKIKFCFTSLCNDAVKNIASLLPSLVLAIFIAAIMQ